MKLSKFFLKRFLWVEIPLQIGISMLTGMFIMLVFIMVMVNGAELQYKYSEISSFLLIGVIMLIICTWFIAFLGAYKSSKTVIQLSILVWTVFIIGWIALSVLPIAIDNKDYCVADKSRCAPSMWLFENGKSSDKDAKSAAVEEKNDLENFDGNILVEDYYNDEYEDESVVLGITNDDATSKDYDDVDADGDEENYAADDDESDFAADDGENDFVESDMPENEVTNVRSATDKTEKHTTRASSIYSDDVSTITNPLSYLITRSVPSEMMKKNSITTYRDDAIMTKRRVKRSFPFKTSSYRATTVEPNFVSRAANKSPSKDGGPKENRLKYIITIAYFLVLFLYSWIVLVSYRMELQCMELCNCDHIICTK